MFKRKKEFKGIIYHNSRVDVWYDELIKKYDRCVVCGSKKDLVPHHITPCSVYDDLFFDVNNGTILCKNCHKYYHTHYFPIDDMSFLEFKNSKHKNNYKPKNKKLKKFNRKKHELSPDYTKIKIKEKFEKEVKKAKKFKLKYRKRRRKKTKGTRLNPIYLQKNLGSEDDTFDYYESKAFENEIICQN